MAPTEDEKVQRFEALGIDRAVLPYRTYGEGTQAQKRFFALKFPVAVDAKAATFVYVDPGLTTDSELRARTFAVQVVAIGTSAAAANRAETVLKSWTRDGDGQGTTGWPTWLRLGDWNRGRPLQSRAALFFSTGAGECQKVWGNQAAHASVAGVLPGPRFWGGIVDTCELLIDHRVDNPLYDPGRDTRLPQRCRLAVCGSCSHISARIRNHCPTLFGTLR